MSSAGHGPLIIPGCGLTLLIISTLLVALRLVARFSRESGKADVGDLFLALGWVFGASLTVIATHGSLTRDYANHIDQVVAVDDLVDAAFYGFIEEILFLAGLSCAKLSIFLFYHTLAVQLGNRKLVWTMRAFITLITTFMIAYFILPLTSCKPFKSTWLQVDPEYNQSFVCLDRTVAATVAGIINCITDFSAGITPLILVQLLKKPVGAKAGLCFLLLLGFLIFAAGIARTVMIRELLRGDENDWTWAAAMVQLAAIWELHFAIICACAPFICRAYQLVRPKVESASFTVRFLNGRKVHATKKLDSRSSNWSLRAKSPSPTKGLKPPVPPAGSRLRRTDPVDGPTNSHMSGKAAGKRKATPTLDLEKALPVAKKSLENDFEITVAYQPSVRQSKMPVLEIQSPTLPPESRYRHSGLSWITSGSNNSRWSGLRTPGTGVMRQKSKSGHTTPKSSVSPSKSPTGSQSPGLISLNMSEQTEIPPPTAIRKAEPSLSPVHVACRGCGQYHPYGYRHGNSEVESNLPFGWWRKTKAIRQSQSTFYDDADDEDEIMSAV